MPDDAAVRLLDDAIVSPQLLEECDHTHEHRSKAPAIRIVNQDNKDAVARLVAGRLTSD